MASQDPDCPDREARIQRLLRAIEHELRQSLPEPDQSLEQIEQQVVEIGRKLREILERDTLEAAGRGYCGTHAPCACGGRARFVAFYRRTVVTLNGEPTLTRAYYHCRACRKGFCPLDKRLQLGRDPHSVGVRALAARFASYLSDREAAAELSALVRIPISARSVHREAVAVRAAPASLPNDTNFYHLARTIFGNNCKDRASEEALGMPPVPIGDGFLLYYFDNRPFRGPRIRPARLMLDPDLDLLTIEATGQDIWSFADSGGFVARPVTGDYQLTVKVLEKPEALFTGDGVDNVKIGPMIRDHVFLGARYAYLAATSGRGVLWERRRSFPWEQPTALPGEQRTAFVRTYSGAEGEMAADDASTRYPLWLRLTKVGAVITASQSNDGSHFTQVGSERTPEDFGQMNPMTYAGFAFIASSPTGRGLIKIQASSLKIEPLSFPGAAASHRGALCDLASPYRDTPPAG
jgi:hypothetical protein